MKQLTLIRHAKSSWSNTTLLDFDRPLNKRGNRDAPMMGERLRSAGVCFDRMVSSPANRALSTSHLIAQEIGFQVEQIEQEAGIYEASFAVLFRLIKAIDDQFFNVALIGHNPGMSMLATRLSTQVHSDLPTCSIVRLQLDIQRWQDLKQDLAKLLDFDYPKKYR